MSNESARNRHRAPKYNNRIQAVSKAHSRFLPLNCIGVAHGGLGYWCARPARVVSVVIAAHCRRVLPHRLSLINYTVTNLLVDASALAMANIAADFFLRINNSTRDVGHKRHLSSTSALFYVDTIKAFVVFLSLHYMLRSVICIIY